MASSLEKALLAGIEKQCDVEAASDGSYSVIGPLHLGELTGYLMGNGGSVELRAKGRGSTGLTEVRTVHSRAVTALRHVRRRTSWDGETPWEDNDLRDEMQSDLEQVVSILDKWRRK
ncbi:hypothetical protein [Mycobacteroides abscessus]|uniref:hypothetical protein n=1 Tax=Mycobacteroides abscessus TaxID=36809 RepID=UPI00078DFA77|nr:hypothetical protein [Mycobacteroides abscessus]AMU74027.1 hypothetical protein A3O06_04585 [Mycobacteroides abscessus]ANO22962.1 hypothetical protein BAB79_04585 [Mycobacteroides abscessus]